MAIADWKKTKTNEKEAERVPLKELGLSTSSIALANDQLSLAEKPD